MANLSTIQQRYIRLGLGELPPEALARAARAAGQPMEGVTERGMRATPEASIRYLYRQMYVDATLRAAILDIRAMDTIDPRVKRIHGRMARTAVKGGLLLQTSSTNRRLLRLWDRFAARLELHRQEKLESDCRGLVMEGNLPIQWVLDDQRQVVAAVRMPSETIVPRVGASGRFLDVAEAFVQYDLTGHRVVASFPLWQLALVRLTPDNWDDKGSLGRPYLDAARGPWRKLIMTEEDLVVRRRQRAPLRMAHVLEGATQEELESYRAGHEAEAGEITTDFYLNRKGSVSALQGDANLDQIADVAHLLDTFFSGAPAPKGLFGYAGDLQRDILEDLKRDYFEEIDALQDTLAYVYELGFRLELLLRGVNPDAQDFQVKFAERRTETPNQAADRALKYQALGASTETVMRAAGLDPALEREQRKQDELEGSPYPDPGNIGPRVNVTPGNARKGESATTIATRG